MTYKGFIILLILFELAFIGAVLIVLQVIYSVFSYLYANHLYKKWFKEAEKIIRKENKDGR